MRQGDSDHYDDLSADTHSTADISDHSLAVFAHSIRIS